MLKILISTVMVLFVSGGAFAATDELDQDPVNQSVKGTVVLRLDQRNGQVSMVQVDSVVKSEEEAKALTTENFTAIPKEKVRSELDKEAGVSSWYWYVPTYSSYYSYSAYYYQYGNYYNSYYSYSYSYYSYYYYNRYSYRW